MLNNRLILVLTVSILAVWVLAGCEAVGSDLELATTMTTTSATAGFDEVTEFTTPEPTESVTTSLRIIFESPPTTEAEPESSEESTVRSTEESTDPSVETTRKATTFTPVPVTTSTVTAPAATRGMTTTTTTTTTPRPATTTTAASPMPSTTTTTTTTTTPRPSTTTTAASPTPMTTTAATPTPSTTTTTTTVATPTPSTTTTTTTAATPTPSTTPTTTTSSESSEIRFPTLPEDLGIPGMAVDYRFLPMSDSIHESAVLSRYLELVRDTSSPLPGLIYPVFAVTDQPTTESALNNAVASYIANYESYARRIFRSINLENIDQHRLMLLAHEETVHVYEIADELVQLEREMVRWDGLKMVRIYDAEIVDITSGKLWSGALSDETENSVFADPATTRTFILDTWYDEIAEALKHYPHIEDPAEPETEREYYERLLEGSFLNLQPDSQALYLPTMNEDESHAQTAQLDLARLEPYLEDDFRDVFMGE